MYKFLLKIVFITLLLALSACVSITTDSNNFLKSMAFPYYAKEFSLPFLSYKYFDLNPYISEGLGFTPLLMPVEPDINLKEADFLVGYWKNKDNLVLPPLPGSCRLVESEKNSSRLSPALKSVHFVSSQPKDADELFLLLDSDTQEIIALVRLNSRGQADCFLERSSFYIATGYGQLRKEFLVKNNENNYSISFAKKSKVVIDANAEKGIYEGDIIRIGRSFSALNLSNLDQNFSEPQQDGSFNSSQIASVLSNDIFLKGNSQTKKMNVEEYFTPSILVGKTPFSITLEYASYTFAVLRKNRLICLQKVDLNEDRDFVLSCPAETNRSASLVSDNSSDNYYFDATFFPSSFIETSAFQHWAFSLPSYFMITPSQNEFLFLLQNPATKNTEYLKDPYVFENSQSGFARQVQSDIPDLKIPLGGEGEEALALGAVPFSSFTKLTIPFFTKEFLSHANAQASNGATLKWYEPYPSLKNGGVLSSLVQQNFRMRLSIPEWNSTNIVEMYVNNKLYKRWILDRGDCAKPYSITLETKTAEAKDFSVHIIARGEDFLSDFLSGLKNTFPFAITRDYWVDVEGKKIQ